MVRLLLAQIGCVLTHGVQHPRLFPPASKCTPKRSHVLWMVCETLCKVDGDIDLFTLVDTEASGITMTVNQVQDYFNTADLTERDFARQVADSVAPIQVAARLALENKGDKNDVLAAINLAVAGQNTGNAYFSNVNIGFSS